MVRACERHGFEVSLQKFPSLPVKGGSHKSMRILITIRDIIINCSCCNVKRSDPVKSTSAHRVPIQQAAEDQQDSHQVAKERDEEGGEVH